MDDEIVDFSAKETVTIGILDGDGIGPIIMPHAVKALETLLAEEIASGSIVLKRIEGLTIENRMTLGQSVPDDVLAEIKTCDVLLKGPTTTPMGGKMESANVTLRRALDLYANCVTKANIMKKTDGKFSAIAHEVAQEYPGITVDDWYTDIMTANLVNEAIRDQFQVVLLLNLYGDIITDEAAQIQGGVDTAGSANIGDRFAMFEAVHGSAPWLIEQGLSAYANPASILRATAMLLRHICRSNAAQRLEQALNSCNLTVGCVHGCAICRCGDSCALRQSKNLRTARPQVFSVCQRTPCFFHMHNHDFRWIAPSGCWGGFG